MKNKTIYKGNLDKVLESLQKCDKQPREIVIWCNDVMKMRINEAIHETLVEMAKKKE